MLSWRRFASVIAEKLFWKGLLSLGSMWLVNMPILLLVNAMLWTAVLGAGRALFGRRPTRTVRGS